MCKRGVFSMQKLRRDRYENQYRFTVQRSETLAKIGKYTVTVTDECGNESVYEFEILKAKKPVNIGLIIAFVVSMMIAVGAATFLIIKKKREG